MRPAFSLIVFTTLSGLGFGLAAIIGLGLITAPTAFWWMVYNGVALALIGAGVISSTMHLGHPERAWRAMTQWRSSWLSREGVLAALTTILLIGFAVDGYINGAPNFALGVAVAVLSLVTIWCTAMIYASLKTVSRWFHPLTPFMFWLCACGRSDRRGNHGFHGQWRGVCFNPASVIGASFCCDCCIDMVQASRC